MSLLLGSERGREHAAGPATQHPVQDLSTQKLELASGFPTEVGGTHSQHNTRNFCFREECILNLGRVNSGMIHVVNGSLFWEEPLWCGGDLSTGRGGREHPAYDLSVLHSDTKWGLFQWGKCAL